MRSQTLGSDLLLYSLCRVKLHEFWKVSLTIVSTNCGRLVLLYLFLTARRITRMKNDTLSG